MVQAFKWGLVIWGTVLSLLEAPSAKTLLSTEYWGRFYSVPCVHHRGAYSVLLTHDNLCKPTPVTQVVVANIVILSNVCLAWTMYLCMDSVKFLLEVPDASILWGRYYLVTTQVANPFGALLLGRALLRSNSRSSLTSKSKVTPFWACRHNNSSPVQARITKFGPKVQNTWIKIIVLASHPCTCVLHGQLS